jgi:hypothetical protein
MRVRLRASELRKRETPGLVRREFPRPNGSSHHPAAVDARIEASTPPEDGKEAETTHACQTTALPARCVASFWRWPSAPYTWPGRAQAIGRAMLDPTIHKPYGRLQSSTFGERRGRVRGIGGRSRERSSASRDCVRAADACPRWCTSPIRHGRHRRGNSSGGPDLGVRAKSHSLGRTARRPEVSSVPRPSGGLMPVAALSTVGHAAQRQSLAAMQGFIATSEHMSLRSHVNA